MKTFREIRWVFVAYAVLTITLFLITPFGLAIILAEGNYSLAFMLIFFTVYMAREMAGLWYKNRRSLPRKGVKVPKSGLITIYSDNAIPRDQATQLQHAMNKIIQERNQKLKKKAERARRFYPQFWGHRDESE